MHVASNPHDPCFQNPCALPPIFVLRDIQSIVPLVTQPTAVLYFRHMAAKNPNKKPKATLDSVLSTVERGFADLEGKMDRGFAAVADDIADIKSTMVTKTEFNEAVEKLDNRLTAVESKIGGIHNRIDDEVLKRANLENRVRSVVPNLPPPPERV
jgi:hypothetical protein